MWREPHSSNYTKILSSLGMLYLPSFAQNFFGVLVKPGTWPVYIGAARKASVSFLNFQVVDIAQDFGNEPSLAPFIVASCSPNFSTSLLQCLLVSLVLCVALHVRAKRALCNALSCCSPPSQVFNTFPVLNPLLPW